jgi:hypothetical protein
MKPHDDADKREILNHKTVIRESGWYKVLFGDGHVEYFRYDEDREVIVEWKDKIDETNPP